MLLQASEELRTGNRRLLESAGPQGLRKDMNADTYLLSLHVRETSDHKGSGCVSCEVRCLCLCVRVFTEGRLYIPVARLYLQPPRAHCVLQVTVRRRHQAE